MIRDRLINAARKAAIKFFNMEFDTEYKDPGTRKVDAPQDLDESIIPPEIMQWYERQ